MKKSEFLQGIRHGIPICLGYFSVSAAFGITAVRSGLPLWTAVLISLTNVTSAGQFAGNRVLGYTAQQTLDYTQNLYEKKLVTYPRTDSRFLTEDKIGRAHV